MADNSLSYLFPKLYYGRDHENAQVFMRYYDRWSEFKNIDNNTKLALLPLLFRENAEIWYTLLQPNEKDTLDNLQTAFATQYNNNDCTQYLQSAKLWSKQQQANQPTAAFIAEIQRAADKIGFPTQQLHQIVLNGLRPEIRKHIITLRPRNLNHLKELALRIEAAILDGINNDDEDIREQIQTVSQEIEKVTQQLNEMNNQITINSEKALNENPSHAEWDKPPHQQWPNQRCEDESQRDALYKPPRSLLSKHQETEQCPRCAGHWHTLQTCPAREKNCFRCGGTGHYKAACGSKHRRRHVH